jgi:hypothetical protein
LKRPSLQEGGTWGSWYWSRYINTGRLSFDGSVRIILLLTQRNNVFKQHTSQTHNMGWTFQHILNKDVVDIPTWCIAILPFALVRIST